MNSLLTAPLSFFLVVENLSCKQKHKNILVKRMPVFRRTAKCYQRQQNGNLFCFSFKKKTVNLSAFFFTSLNNQNLICSLRRNRNTFSAINTSLKCMQPIPVLKSYVKLSDFSIIIKMLARISNCLAIKLIWMPGIIRGEI